MHKIQYQKKDTPPALYDLARLTSAVHNYYNIRYATNQTCADHFPELNMAEQGLA